MMERERALNMMPAVPIESKPTEEKAEEERIRELEQRIKELEEMIKKEKGEENKE